LISGNLFTRDYLLEGIRTSPPWLELSDAKARELTAKLRGLAQKLTAGVKPNEAQTERDFIYPVLSLLGWRDMEVQQTLSATGRKQVPDALLFADEAARNKAVAERDHWRRYQFGLSIVEAKRWARALDRTDKKEVQEEGVPSTQMLQYLSRVDVQTSGKVRLGILTNGVIWRLYFQGALSVSEDYFEVNLGKALELPGYERDLIDLADERLTPEHAVRLFALMFGKAAFLPMEGALTFHELSRQAGKLWEEKVTKDLSNLVFEELFPMLVTNLHRLDPAKPATIDNEYLEAVRQAALILLYRLLFVVYAEDRDLLPDSQEPYKSYSLTALRLEVAERMEQRHVFSTGMATYWPKITAVFGAIANGNDELGIPPYNGGLFAADAAPLLQRVSIPDAIIAEAVFKLSHRQDTEGSTPRYINYRDLGVQQLGTIYERTLEYGLKVQDGTVVVDEDDKARHESGSYYTADSLVSLIIERTIGPLVEACRKAFQEKAAELAGDNRPADIKLAELQGYDPALAILELRVCDPAMGSGHFLVNLVDWLADKTLASIAEAELLVDWSEKPYRSPVLSSIEQTRADIIRQATKRKWPFVVEHLDDRHIIRRSILKRCIYGVDKNPMAVELAKVALWLHTFTVGAPLSFLDHHLRKGNSLLGFWVSDAIERVVRWGGQLLINEPMQQAMAQAMAMQRLERVNDIDLGEVHESKTIFDGIEQETKPFNSFLQLLYALDWLKLDKLKKARVKAWLDGQFGEPLDIGRGKIVLGGEDGGTGYAGARDGLSRLAEPARSDAKAFAGTLNEARGLARGELFFNWQVAFPGVWSEWDRKTLKGGFDAVIGNPPYVRQELIKDIKPALKRAFPATYDGAADLYVYFYEQGLRLLKPGGRLSYVVTNKWMKAAYADGLRDMLGNASWVEFVADFGHAKNFFPDADVFPSIVVARQPEEGLAPETTGVCAIARDDVPEKGLDKAVAEAEFRLPRTSFGRDNWVLEPAPVLDLLAKIRGGGRPLHEYAGLEPQYGIKTGFNKAFLIDGPTRESLVAAHPDCAGIIKPYLRGQDIKRWSSSDSGLFMIVLKSSENADWPWSKAKDAESAEAVFKKAYPSLYRHLKPLQSFLDEKSGKMKGLEHREDQGRFWWELRSCAYYDAFERPKITYQVIQYHSRFSFDADGRMGNDKTFFIGADDPWLLAVLNSPLMWWYNWRLLPHLKDEALSPMAYKMANLPIAQPSSQKDLKAAEKATGRMIALSSETRAANGAIADWLKHEFGIVKGGRELGNSTHLSEDGFIGAVRAALPKKRMLTAAEIGHLQREFKATIAPAASLVGEARQLERELSDAVTAAYGFSSDEAKLMWATSPVRMPLLEEDLDSEEVDDDGEDA
jgi:hypothetical protein